MCTGCVNRLFSHTRLCIRQAKDLSGVQTPVLFLISPADNICYAQYTAMLWSAKNTLTWHGCDRPAYTGERVVLIATPACVCCANSNVCICCRSNGSWVADKGSRGDGQSQACSYLCSLGHCQWHTCRWSLWTAADLCMCIIPGRKVLATTLMHLMCTPFSSLSLFQHWDTLIGTSLQHMPGVGGIWVSAWSIVLALSLTGL